MKNILITFCVVFAAILVYQLGGYLMSTIIKDKIKVEPFLALGNDKEVFFKGRVIKAYTQKRPSSRKNWLSNIISAVKRYAGSSVPSAKVEINFQDKSYVVTTDEDGVFELHVGDSYLTSDQSEPATFYVLEPKSKVATIAYMEVTRYSGNLGIISDIDDTILISHSTDIGKKFWLSVSKNAFSRRPLPGVSEFYKKITSDSTIPIFYVSSSDWSLFDLIKDFLRYRHIPEGPILLKDKHINLKNIWKSGGGDHSHKLQKIELLMDLFPQMQFNLIGDSGQHDPEIYAQVIKDYPGRVKDVFIRIVGNLDPNRATELKKLHGFDHFHFIQSSEEAIEILEKESITH
ncbi:phosphatase domain-containing protein [Algoriphagus sp.]|uniref:phosphatase domain-containing protein n=1 Tax=Algoriphagus sp. TaxID=1872435 RepID=UPI00328279EB